jgi:hypothetical protein
MVNKKKNFIIYNFISTFQLYVIIFYFFIFYFYIFIYMFFIFYLVLYIYRHGKKCTELDIQKAINELNRVTNQIIIII